MPAEPSPSPTPNNLSEWTVLVGRVSGRWSHSDLKIQPFSPVEGRFAQGQQVAIDWKGANGVGGKRLLTILKSYPKGHAVIADCGLSTDEVEAVQGAQLWIHPSMRPTPPEGEFYYDQLIGLRVRSESGRDLGEIEDVLESKAHMIYVTPRAMIPGVEEIVVSIDFEAKLVTVRDMPGLTDEG
jgi:16S rRNA processing protein RimM